VVDLSGYLGRLGVPEPGPPSAAALRRLHAAHVERIAYDNLDVQLGRPQPCDGPSTFARIAAGGRGGYCFHQNAGFGTLLAALGYDVRRHRGVVWHRRDGHGPDLARNPLNHLALTVHGLPDPTNPGGSWFVDAGLGDGPWQPLPFVDHICCDGPFGFRLEGTRTQRWRFVHDPAIGSFTAVDVWAQAPSTDLVDERHRWLSTAPESGFVKVLAVLRRDRDGVDVLRGCVLTRIGVGGRRGQDVTDPDAWWTVLADRFGLRLDDVTPAERASLWQRTWSSHERWVAAGRP